MRYARNDLRNPARREPAPAFKASRKPPSAPRAKPGNTTSAGAKPSRAAKVARAKSWLLQWFRHETHLLTALNAVLSITVLVLAVPLLPFDISNLTTRSFFQLTSFEPSRLAADAGFVLCAAALLVALHSLVVLRRKWFRRTIGLALSILLLAGGAWLIAVGLYAGNFPALMKPAIALVAQPLTADLDYFEAQIVPKILPGLAMLLGFVLSAKQLRSAVSARNQRFRKFFALAGLAASASTLVIGAYAGELSNSADRLGDIIAPGRISFLSREAYASPVAAGVPCHISDSFGERRNPFDVAAYEFHPGIDMAVAAGTPVHAMASGTVVFAGADGGFGNIVAIRTADGAGAPTLLAGHMREVAVSEGDAVQSGEVIGYAGSTGRSTGPHIHLQVCPEARLTRYGGFICGRAANPYENWRMLLAIARASCVQGPTVWRVSEASPPAARVRTD